MAAFLDLTPKPPRYPGLTRSNPYAPLHGDGLQAKQEPLDDVNAPPKSSSDEESETEDAEATIVLSNSSPPRARKSKNQSSHARELRARAEISPSKKGVATTDVEPYKNPADIRRTVFVSDNKSKVRNGSKKSENGRKEMNDNEDDQLEMWSSQSKRVKPNHAYGRSSQQATLPNFHLEPPKKSKQHVKRVAASMKVSDDGFKTPVFDGESPRSQRASQRSSKTAQGPFQTAPKKVFKKPPRVSPKKTLHQFRTSGPPIENKGIGRAVRSSATSRKPYVSTDPIKLDTAALSGAVHVAAEKLGIPDVQFKPPPSSKTTSSLPSNSFDDTSDSSTLSSPPPEIEIIDVSPTQKNVEYVTHAALIFAQEDSGPKCPLCNERVESLFFEEWTGGRRLTIRQQADFCRAYKKHTAESEWRKQGFPHIDWQCLDERLNKHHYAIDDILQGRRFSFYRNVFEDLVKSGKDRKLRKTLMNGAELEESTPGYYGSRGARIMYGSVAALSFSHSG